MKAETMIAKFNIPLLIRRGILDVTGTAGKYPELAAEDYFGKVEEAVLKIPNFLENRENHGEARNDMVKLLDEIGADKSKADAPEALNALYNGISAVYSRKGRYKTQVCADEGLSLQALISAIEKAEETRRLRVLAVDDIPVVLIAITMALGKDYDVYSLTKSDQVKEFLAHTVPDLFLLDIEMPGMNGYDLVNVIRSFAEHEDTPVMFLTGNATVKNYQVAMALEAVDFITKPVSPDVLFEKVKDKIVRKKLF